MLPAGEWFALLSISRLGSDAFASLAQRNYRRFFIGQLNAQLGQWMQAVAQAWLVLELTGSGVAIGLVVALQTLPVLIFGPYGGLIADRTDKRKLLIVIQAVMVLQSLALGILTITHLVELWHVFALAVVFGLGACFDRPARQSFTFELVGADLLRNAVSLNSVTLNVARAVGPAIAGLIIAAGGLGLCFILSAITFVTVIISLVWLDVSELRPEPVAPRERGQLRQGFRYVRGNPNLSVPLMMMALIGCLAYEFQVVLPIMARDTFDGDSRTYGFLSGAIGIGAVIGGLYTAARGETGMRPLVRSAAIFGVTIGVAAIAPTFGIALVAMTFVGAASVMFLSTSSTTLQLEADPLMRGRVMALFSMCLLGTTPIGGPIAGLVSEELGGRAGLALGAVACFISAAGGAIVLRRAERRTNPA